LNPGTDVLLKLEVQEQGRSKGNSPNHGGDGQNVLYAGGHVAFQTTPFAGLRHAVGGPRDNIFTYGNTLPGGAAQAAKSGDGIVGSSTSGIDSVLLPTAKDLGVVDAKGALTPDEVDRRAGTPALFKPVDAEMRAKLIDSLKGTYVREVDGKQMTLRVTDTQLVGSVGVVTITYDYTLTAAADRRHAKLSVTGADMEPIDVTLRQTGPRLHVRGTPFFEGEWTPKRGEP
jgi:prepilin-type processing-associated H-X9-DG protein